MERTGYIYRVTITGSIINFFLVIFKLLAGILGSSSAMIADAAHSLSDFASDIIVVLCVRISSKPEDEDHAYGHGKFETLAAVAIGLILLGTGIGLFWDGLSSILAHLQGGRLKQPTWIALIAAMASILIKEGLYHYTINAAKKADSNTLKVNAWHHRSDALTSLATVIGIGGSMLPGDTWLILDPLAACVISLFIIGMSFSLMKPAIDELMEKSLPADDMAIIEGIITTAPGVQSYHHLRTRRMGMNRAVEVHIKLDGGISLREAHDIATAIEEAIKAELGEKTHIGIHMEPAKEVKANRR